MLYTGEPPRDFNPKLLTVGCFVECNNEILLLLRHLRKPHGNTWGMPAGKIEVGEDPRSAMVRELKEETDIEIEANEISYLAEGYVRIPEYDFIYHIFKLKFTEKPIIQLEHDCHTKYLWTTPTDAKKLSLFPGTDSCIDFVYA